MASETKGKTDTKLDGSAKAGTKRRTQRDGRACPPGTYIRDTLRGPIWHAKIQVSGQSFDGSTGILESDPNSRKTAKEWVADKKAEMRVAQKAARQAPQQVTLPLAPVVTTEVSTIYISDEELDYAKRTVAAVAGQEIQRFEVARAGSPHIGTVCKQMDRIIEFFGRDTDVSTIKMSHVNAYIRHRREMLTQRKTPVSYETIYRELEGFQRGIQCANDDEVFVPRFKLPINAAQRRNHLDDHVVYDDQRNHSEYTHAECSRWINAARGHKIYHFFRLAYLLGMRKHEIEYLRWSNIVEVKQPRHEGHVAEIRLPKHLYKLQKELLDNKPLPLSRSLYAELLSIYQQGDGDADEPLFGRLSNSVRTCEKLQQKTGLYIHLRDLRACFGRRKLELTGNMRQVQVAMRHASLSTTEGIYVRPGSLERSDVAQYTFDVLPDESAGQ